MRFSAHLRTEDLEEVLNPVEVSVVPMLTDFWPWLDMGVLRLVSVCGGHAQHHRGWGSWDTGQGVTVGLVLCCKAWCSPLKSSPEQVWLFICWGMCLIHYQTTSIELIFMLDICIFVFFNYICSEIALWFIKMITEIISNWCILYLLWFRNFCWFFRMSKFSQMKPPIMDISYQPIMSFGFLFVVWFRMSLTLVCSSIVIYAY